MKKALFVRLAALLAATAILITGCTAAPEADVEPTAAPQTEAAVKQDAAITVSMPRNAASMSPYKVQERQTAHILSLIYEGMVRLDEKGVPVAALAEKWEIAEDGKTWTFTLRSGITFHDGDPLTAEDVVYSYRQVKNNPDCLYYEGFSHVSSITAANDSTVTVRLTQPDYTVLFAMNFPVVKNGSIASNVIGTGPYVLTAADEEGMTLTANKNWWRKQGTISTVNIVYQEGAEETVGAFLSGRTDVAYITSGTWGETGVANQNYTVHTVPTHQYEFIAMNYDTGLLQDRAVRQALS